MRKALLNPPKLSPMMSLEDANRLNEAMKQMKESRASRPGEITRMTTIEMDFRRRSAASREKG